MPFIENCLVFIPFFMLNNRVADSQYFANIDLYLLYVLLFAILYGQRQATISAILATAGYLFRQSYSRSSFELALDYNTYVWIAQLFILGLVVGYLKDRVDDVRDEGNREIDYLTQQVDDINDINTTNVKIKNVLETQVINQNDSFGKVYEITSTLDQYGPDEVIFYAAEVLKKLIRTEDVAIYSIANAAFARLFAATSKKARSLGNSIKYNEYDEMMRELNEGRVYINKNLNEAYPLMADAIYENGEMAMIIMIWGIPWDRMNLGQANMLRIIGYLIQNAVLRSNRYLDALEQERYLEGTRLLEIEAFESLVKAYSSANKRGVTESCLVQVLLGNKKMEEAVEVVSGMLRDSDYMGRLSEDTLFLLLPNTDENGASFVRNRLKEKGFETEILEDID